VDGKAFGKEIFKIRKKVGLSTRELSRLVGKNITYVSHLERGNINKPDFTACYNMLKVLGVEEENIENILSGFGILSPEREQTELRLNSFETQPILNFSWYDKMAQKLNVSNDRFHDVLSLFIEKDFTKSEKLITNLSALITTKETFDFLISLFEYDYSRISSEDRKEILEIIRKFILSKYEYDQYDDFIRKQSR